MSAISASYPSAASSLPITDAATVPAAVREGGQKAKNAYETGLGFEQMLVTELTQQMTNTISGTGSGSDGLGGTTDGSGGLSGSTAASDPASGAYSSLLPGALTSGIMSGGGTGIAMQIADGIDPALLDAPASHATQAARTSSGGTAL